MITSKKSYTTRSGLPYYKINSFEEETLISVDLNSRIIDKENRLNQFNILLHDNYSETIYFIMDRYFDNQDLLDTLCDIVFFNAELESYAFPIHDKGYRFITTKDTQGKPSDYRDADGDQLVIAWPVPYAATKYIGQCQFSIQFFQLEEKVNPDEEQEVIYKLNTKPAFLTIKDTLNIDGNGSYDDDYLATEFEKLLNRTIVLEDEISGSQTESSDESGGKNVFTFTTKKGQTLPFTVYNGKQGEQGIPGDPGLAATVEIYGTETSAPGTNAIVQNVGTTSAAQLQFTIPRGAKGDKGDTGDAFTIYKTYPTIDAMNNDAPNVEEGKFVLIASETGVEDPDNAKLFVKNAINFSFLTDLSGARGIQGPPGIQGDPGNDLTISNTTFEYGISADGEELIPGTSWHNTKPTVPQGRFLLTKTTFHYSDGTTKSIISSSYYGVDGIGKPGTSATISIESTSTGAPGTSAMVENIGTSSAARLKFTIPQGLQGPKGDNSEFIVLTQAEYDALTSRDATKFYLIQDA